MSAVARMRCMKSTAGLLRLEYFSLRGLAITVPRSTPVEWSSISSCVAARRAGAGRVLGVYPIASARTESNDSAVVML